MQLDMHPAKFSPVTVTITLETAEELSTLVGLLNAAPDVIRRIVEPYYVHCDPKTLYPLWTILDDVAVARGLRT